MKKTIKTRVFYFQILFVFSLKLAKNLPSLGWETKIKIATALVFLVLHICSKRKHYTFWGQQKVPVQIIGFLCTFANQYQPLHYIMGWYRKPNVLYTFKLVRIQKLQYTSWFTVMSHNDQLCPYLSFLLLDL